MKDRGLLPWTYEDINFGGEVSTARNSGRVTSAFEAQSRYSCLQGFANQSRRRPLETVSLSLAKTTVNHRGFGLPLFRSEGNFLVNCELVSPRNQYQSGVNWTEGYVGLVVVCGCPRPSPLRYSRFNSLGATTGGGGDTQSISDGGATPVY